MYGEAESSGWDFDKLLSTTAGIVAAVSKDPVRQAGVLKAQLESAIARGRPAREIAELRAKWEAAERAASLADETVNTQRAWNQIGQVAVVSGVGLLMAGAFYLTARALRETR